MCGELLLFFWACVVCVCVFHVSPFQQSGPDAYVPVIVESSSAVVTMCWRGSLKYSWSVNSPLTDMLTLAWQLQAHQLLKLGSQLCLGGLPDFQFRPDTL